MLMLSRIHIEIVFQGIPFSRKSSPTESLRCVLRACAMAATWSIALAFPVITNSFIRESTSVCLLPLESRLDEASVLWWFPSL